MYLLNSCLAVLSCHFISFVIASLSFATSGVRSCQHKYWQLVVCGRQSAVVGSRKCPVEAERNFPRGKIFDSVRLPELGIARSNPNSPRTPQLHAYSHFIFLLFSSSLLSIFPRPSSPPCPALTAANFILLQNDQYSPTACGHSPCRTGREGPAPS